MQMMAYVFWGHFCLVIKEAEPKVSPFNKRPGGFLNIKDDVFIIKLKKGKEKNTSVEMSIKRTLSTNLLGTYNGCWT